MKMYENEAERLFDPPSFTKENSDAAGGRIRIAVISLRATADGDWITVTVELCDTTRDLCERQSIAVATELLGELGIRRGEIMPDAYEALEQAGKVSQAMRRALSVLSCGANSTRTLEQKLRARGFSAEISAQAVRRLADKGYLCEGQDACRVAQRSLDKGWGMRRIIEDLRCRGYGKNALEDARSMLSCEDFTARCCRAARKKMRTYPSTLTERQKLTAFLMRYGYDADEIRRAIRPETWSGDGEM